MKYILISFMLFVGTYTFAQKPDLNAGENDHINKMVEQILQSNEKIKTLAYRLEKKERLKGKFYDQISYTKLNLIPYMVYIRQDYPKVGTEALFKPAENDGQVLINPSGFPWININLDPYNKWVREGQHHTIYNCGFSKIVFILEHLSKKYEDLIDKVVKYEGIEEVNGKSCYKLVFTSPDFKYIDYMVQENENLIEIGDRLFLSNYMIMEYNDLNDYLDIKPGEVIKIPTDYSKEMKIYFDKENLLPVLFETYDDQGLYERFQYSNVEVNPDFKKEEFESSYDEYGF